MSYYHLTINERESILEYIAKGDSIRKIALKLQRSPSTISRELNRSNSHHSPSKAQKAYLERRRNCHKPRLLDQNSILCEKIAALIQDKHWSPEQIANRLRKEHLPSVSYNTIYRHLNNHNLNQTFNSHGDTGIRRKLRHRGRKRSRNKSRKHQFPKVDYISIDERPNFINQRKRIGDWEIDTVMGKTGSDVLVTAVDRKTRYTLIGRAKHKNAKAVNQTLLTMFLEIPKEFRLSLTPDHGVEFLTLSEIRADIGVTIYWPNPYSPEERGTNENTNGLIREYFPRNRDIKLYTNKDIENCQRQLNQRPRKVLDFQTPEEVFYDKVLHLD